MTLTPSELALYAAAVLGLFLTPGPVWVALIARGVAGGFHAAWPLAVGVVVGDAVWPLAAIFGLAWITSVYAGFLGLLRWVAVCLFLGMGLQLLRLADRAIVADSRLTAPGAAAGFFAGLSVILGNPKAIIFYMGALPGFFDLSQVTGPDIAAIVLVSMVVPLAGNLVLAAFLDRTKALLAAPGALKRTHQVSGLLLIGVGLVIALS